MNALWPAMLSSALFTLGCSRTLGAQEFNRWSAFCEGVGHTAGIALGDIDGDDDLDVVFANGRHLAERDWVYSNDGRGVFYGRRALESQPDRSYGVALGDLNADGSLDAVVANDAGNRSVVYRNDGLGNFVSIAGLGSHTLSEGRRAVALGDLDRDGDLDAVLVGDGQDHLYLNRRSGLEWEERAFGSADRGLSVVVQDLDADGDEDIAVAYRRPGWIGIYRNDGNARFEEERIEGDSGSDPTGLAVGDVDGDEDIDLVAVSWGRPHQVFLNDNGVFREGAPFGDGAELAWSVALGDLDLDGDLDAAVGAANLGWWYDDLDQDGAPDRSGNQPGTAPSRIYLNDGNGRFTSGSPIQAGNDDSRPIALGDVDRDGDLDVVMGNDCQPNYIFFNPTLSPGPG